MAAQAHGARRTTIDFDCLTHDRPVNLTRLCATLTELNARLRIEGMSDDDAKAISRGVIDPELAFIVVENEHPDGYDRDGFGIRSIRTATPVTLAPRSSAIVWT